jgi:hypothetical protein
MTTSNVVIVKFVHSGEPSIQSERICKLVGRDQVKDARQLFPGDAEEDLASLYEIILDDTVPLNQALTSLNSDEQVEYAHVPQARRAF